jgi:hypothetical protein
LGVKSEPVVVVQWLTSMCGQDFAADPLVPVVLSAACVPLAADARELATDLDLVAGG